MPRNWEVEQNIVKNRNIILNFGYLMKTVN